ncbi:MAG TPA: O-antigen ligase family protein [Bryobacteraceae bacterium]|jgi:O-antigen ligase
MNVGGVNRWNLPLAIAAIPLAIAPGVLFFYDVTPKLVILYLAVAAALPLVNARRLLATPTGRMFCGLLAASLLSVALSSWFSMRGDLSVLGTNWRRFGLTTQGVLLLFAFLCAADLSCGADRMRTYLRASTVASLVAASYATLQYLGWDPWIDPRTYHIGSGVWTIVRPPGTLGYVTYLANYLVFGTFQALALYRIEREQVWRRFAMAAVVLSVIAVVLSGTRAGWIALAAGGLVLWMKEGWRPSRRTIGIAAGAAVIAIAFYFSAAGTPMRGRMRWFREDPAGGARLYLWRDSVKLLGRHLLWGSGPESFSVEFPQVQSADLSRAFPEFYHESAHNMFLDAATAQGLPGLLVLAACAGLGLASKGKPGALIAGLTAILVCHQFSVFTIPTALTFWITLAMLISEPQAAGPPRTNYLLIPVSMILLVVAARSVMGDRHLELARKAMDASRSTEAAAEYQAAQGYGVRSDLWFSRRWLVASQESRTLPDSVTKIQQALTWGLRATETAEDPGNAWMNSALIYARLNNTERTEYCIRQAVSASPEWYKPHLALSQLLLATDRRQEGDRERLIAMRLNPTLTTQK